MGDISLFVYGTLMSAEVVAKVLKSTSTSHTIYQSAILSGYCRHKVKNEFYPAAIPEEGSHIIGALIEGITAEEMQFLDEYEGHEYSRETVSVTVGDAIKRCHVYIWIDGEERLSEEDWTPERSQLDQFLESF